MAFTNAKRMKVNAKWMSTIASKMKSRKQWVLNVDKVKWDPNSQPMKVYKGLPIIARIDLVWTYLIMNYLLLQVRMTMMI